MAETYCLKKNRTGNPTLVLILSFILALAELSVKLVSAGTILALAPSVKRQMVPCSGQIAVT